jgi:polysaccharide pyruvyl transferase WcaK-like protein
VLCAGVPLGANNVGDEAIITGVVRMIRNAAPQAQITVATADPATTMRALDVQTCPSFGFDGVPVSGPEVDRVMAEHDLLVWPGATGLSDYPEIPLSLMETAHRLHKRSAVLCVGMSDQLNPHLYQVRSRWRPAYDSIRRITRGGIDLAAWIEAHRKAATYRRMREVLPRADLVVVRDSESEAALRKAGVPGKIVVSADAAMGLCPSPLDRIPMPEATRRALSAPGSPRLGLCLSAQDPPSNLSVIVSVLDRLMAEAHASVFGIPINPVTDARLMSGMLPQFKARDRVFLVEGIQDPEAVAGVLGQMDVIVSSRLHGLILGSLSDIPLVGIRRGTKIDAFLRPYGLRPAGSFQSLEAGELERQIRQRLAQSAEFRRKAAAVRLEARNALSATVQLLKSLFENAMAGSGSAA